MPKQLPGSAPTRALPYQPLASVSAGLASLSLTLSNQGSAALQLASYAYHLAGVSQRFDIAPRSTVHGEVVFVAAYDLAIHGPNGFKVEAAGSLLTAGVEVEPSLVDLKLQLRVVNTRPLPVTIGVSGRPGFEVPANGSQVLTVDPLAADHGWYDVTFSLTGQPLWQRRFAGHIENGKPSRTG